MRVTVVKENDKFYLDIERPHYPSGVYDEHIEVRKIMVVITRNIESYLDDNNSSSLQWCKTYGLVRFVKYYFEDNPSAQIIRMPYLRDYPVEFAYIRYGFLKLRKLWYYKLSSDFVKNEIKVLKVRG